MKLDVIIDDKNHRIDVPPEMLTDAESFFQKMDQDMDHGWQMGPEFIELPDSTQRCQIAANKLLTSYANDNQLMVQLMAAYILKRLPGIKGINIDTSGEMQHTELIFEEGARRGDQTRVPSRPLSETEARARADKDVSPVYKVGRSWRFAVYDPAAGRWIESPFTDTQEAAQQQRDQAYAQMVQAMLQGRL